MNKKICSILVLIIIGSILLFCSSAIAEEDIRKSGLFSYTLKWNGEAKIIGFDWEANDGKDVFVPQLIDGFTVTEIGDYAFSSVDAGYEENPYVSYTLTYGKNDAGSEKVNVTLPNTITKIGKKAFFCTNILSCTIPENVEIIDDGAFAGCNELAQHNVATGNATFATIDGVLYNKTNKVLISVPGKKHSVTIPNGITQIGNYAFYGILFKENETPIFPETVKSIGDYAFAYTIIDGFDIDVINLGAVETVGEYAFYRAIWGTNYELIMSHVTDIGAHAFEAVGLDSSISSWGGTINTLSFPSTLNSLGEYAFANYFNVGDNNEMFHDIDLSKANITTIPPYAFSNFSFRNGSIGKILLPPSLCRIEEGAFQNIIYTVIIEFPSSLEYIGTKAFSTSYWYTSYDISFAEKSELSVIDSYAFNNVHFKNDAIILPDKLIRIGEGAFSNISSITLTIPSSVTEIGSNAFTSEGTLFISAEKNSYAEQYALENRLNLVGDDDIDWLNN